LPQIKCQESLVQKEISQQIAKNFNTSIGDICTNNFNFTEADSYIRGIYQTIKSSQNLIFGFMIILFFGICILGAIEGRGLVAVVSKILTNFGLAMFGYVFGVFMIFGGSLYTTNFLRNSVFPDNFVKELSLIISQNALSFSWQIVSASVFVAFGFFVAGKVLSVFK
jgi:hypothetical protein